MVKAAGSRKNPLAACANIWAVVNLMLFIVTMALAAHLADRYFSGVDSVLGLMTRGAAVLAFVFFALLASSVGIATSLLGFLHTMHFSEAARLATLAANMVTLALTWLAAGFGIKSLDDELLSGSSQYPRQAKALASLFIILMATTLAYVINLGLFKHDHHTTTVPAHTATTYDNNGANTLPTHNKQFVDHGHNNTAVIA